MIAIIILLVLSSPNITHTVNDNNNMKMINELKKASDTDAEVSEATKTKKHVTMEKPSSRSSTPKIAASSGASATDIRNRYLMTFHYLFIVTFHNHKFAL